MSVKLSKVSQLLCHVHRLRENKQGNQLPGVLFVLVWTTVVFDLFPFTKWPLNTGQDNRNSSSGLSKGWPRPLNRGDRLIEVKITVIKGSNFRDFDNWPLNRGWPLNTGPLNTGSTVVSCFGSLLGLKNIYFVASLAYKFYRRFIEALYPFQLSRRTGTLYFLKLIVTEYSTSLYLEGVANNRQGLVALSVITNAGVIRLLCWRKPDYPQKPFNQVDIDWKSAHMHWL